MSLALILTTLILPIFPILVLILYVNYSKKNGSNHALNVAFFHPYCDAGGGGERVLWAAIDALHRRYPTATFTVFTGDIQSNATEIRLKALTRFNAKIPENVHFVYLRWRCLVEAQYYPVLTLLGQTLGGAILAVEAMIRMPNVDVFVDSMGYPGSLAIFRLFSNCKVVAYVHYPTISTDMLNVVSNQKESFNNSGIVARNKILTRVKWYYYWLFAKFYGILGRCTHLAMVNSTWTKGHIVDIWGMPNRTKIVYPPCDVASFSTLKNSSEENLALGQPMRILSIAQFRPEKDHFLQIEAFSHFLASLDEKNSIDEDQKPVLVLAGSCRHSEDLARVEMYKKFADTLKISHNIEWHLNVPFGELCSELSNATIGLHSMRDEHFGIGVVECMAAGCIILAHNSAGPKMDIVKPAVVLRDGQKISDVENFDTSVGFLAQSAQEYADSMMCIFEIGRKSRDEMRSRAGKFVEKFGQEKFEASFLEAFGSVLGDLN